ncbi:MAG: hypothetical protein ACRDRL_25260, partial [Sciscionella sp.]
MALNGQQIYELMSQTDVSALQPAFDGAEQLCKAWPQRALEIEKFANGMQSFWQGNAADGASSAAATLAAKFRSSGEDMNITQDLVQRQQGSAAAIKNAVVPVPPGPSPRDLTCYPGQPPGAPAKAMTMLQAHQDAGEANTAQYANFVNSSSFNVTNLPTLAAADSGSDTGGGGASAAGSGQSTGGGAGGGPTPGA